MSIGTSTKEVFDEMYEVSANHRIALEAEISMLVDVLGDTYDEFIELEMKHKAIKDHLLKLVNEYDEKFSDEDSKGVAKPIKGLQYRAIYSSCSKKNVLSVTPQEFYNAEGVGIDYFSVNITKCKTLKQEHLDRFFSKAWGGRSLKSVSKYC